MALEFEATSLDRVPEAIRCEYVKEGDKYRLNVTGLEDTRALKSAHERVKSELTRI